MTGEAGAAAAAIDAPAQGVGVGRIVLASLIGTAIEFYDFYIYRHRRCRGGELREPAQRQGNAQRAADLNAADTTALPRIGIDRSRTLRHGRA